MQRVLKRWAEKREMDRRLGALFNRSLSFRALSPWPKPKHPQKKNNRRMQMKGTAMECGSGIASALINFMSFLCTARIFVAHFGLFIFRSASLGYSAYVYVLLKWLRNTLVYAIYKGSHRPFYLPTQRADFYDFRDKVVCSTKMSAAIGLSLVLSLKTLWHPTNFGLV